MATEEELREAIDLVANALAAAVLLAAQVRRTAGEQADDTIKLEAAVDAAARAIRRLEPKEGR